MLNKKKSLIVKAAIALYLFFLQFTSGQDTIKLEGTIINKKIDVLEILKNVKKNVKKNYTSDLPIFLDAKLESKKLDDTIIYFDGIINFSADYINNISDAKLCLERGRYVKIQQFIDWFPDKVGKSSKHIVEVAPTGKKIPFFLDDVFRFFAIKNIPIFQNTKDFKYNTSFLEKYKLKVNFLPKNPKYPYKGSLIIDYKSFALLEINYSNSEAFYIDDFVMVNFVRRKDLETPEYVKKLQVNIVYTKNNGLGKYSLEKLSTYINFEKNNGKDYSANSSIKSINEPSNCKNEQFDLAFIDPFFKIKKDKTSKFSDKDPSLFWGIKINND